MATTEAAYENRPRLRRGLASPHFKLAASCFVLYVFYIDFGMVSDNAQVRYALARAIVDHGTFCIDRYTDMLGLDRAVFAGHTYCDKPPGSSFLAIPGYVASKLFVRRSVFGVWTQLVRASATTCLSVCVLAAVSVALLYEVLRLVGVERGRIGYCLAYGVGTWAFPYATTMVGAQFAAPLVTACLWVALRGSDRWHLFWLGLLVGLTFVTHYHAVFIVGWLIPLRFVTLKSKPRIGWALAPALAFLGLQLAYNAACFAGPFDISYSHWRGGLNRIMFAWPSWRVLHMATFSPWKGIFYHSPWLLFAAAGFVFLWSERRGLALCLVLGTVFFLGFIILNNQPGGHNWWDANDFGSRGFVPVLPFLAVAAAVGIAKLLRRVQSGAGRRVVVVVVACTVGFAAFVNSLGALTSPVTHRITQVDGIFYAQQFRDSPKIRLDGVRNILFGYTLKRFLAHGSGNLLTETVLSAPKGAPPGFGLWMLNMATNGIPVLVMLALWWGQISGWLLRPRESGA